MKNIKNQNINIRVSEEEKKQISKEAHLRFMNLTEYLLYLVEKERENNVVFNRSEN